MTPKKKRVAVGAGTAAAVVALAAGGFVAGDTGIAPFSAAETTTVQLAPATMGCNDWDVTLSTGECQAAGTIRYVSLYNLQGAVQFCKWRAANPGEWSRLKTYASDGQSPANIVTWMGGHIQNDLQAYFVAGGPVFDNPSTTVVESIPPNTSPNACTGKLVAPPLIKGVTPGQTDATVTVTTSP